MTLPALPAANLEVRRLLDAGRPVDGNMVPLLRALVASHLVVPMHPQGGVLRFARAHARRPGTEEVVLNVFTAHELAARWARTVRDTPPATMAVASSIAVCKQAIAQGIDVIDIDRGAAGYSLRFRGMIDLLTRVAFDGTKSIVFEAVSVGYGVPKTMPPPAMLDELRRIGRAHAITHLSWCMGWMGDAPAEMQLVYAPYPNEPFAEAVLARMNDMTRDRFTCSTHDAARHAVPAQHLQPLI